MYREHLLSIDHVQRLLYHQVDGPDGRRTLRALPSSLTKTAQRIHSSLTVAKPSDVSRSLPLPLRLHYLSHFPSMRCQHLLFSFLIIQKRFC